MNIDLGIIDWELLRKQKATLLDEIALALSGELPETAEHLEGICGLIDHIQDTAAETLGEEVVFGKSNPE